MKRNLRMLSGAVLYVFVTSHLLNMAFGLLSVDAVENARTFLTAPWAGPPLAPVLMVSMLVHMGLSLEAIYRRNTLRMSSYDTVQLVSGLLIVPLLASHIVGIWAAKFLIGFDPTYRIILTYFWLDAPHEGLRQVLVVVVAWLHGSIGIFSWLRLKASWTGFRSSSIRWLLSYRCWRLSVLSMPATRSSRTGSAQSRPRQPRNRNCRRPSNRNTRKPLHSGRKRSVNSLPWLRVSCGSS